MNSQVIVVGSHSIHTHRFVLGLSKRIDKVILISNKDVQIANNVSCHIINFSLKNLFAARQIGKILRHYGAQNDAMVVHIHQANSYAYHTIRAIRKYKIAARIILTTWGSDVLILPHKNWLMHKMVCYNLKHAHVVTSDSLYMSSQILQLVKDKPIDLRTINFGVAMLPELQQCTAKKNIIFSNRLHKPLYRIDKIICAFAKLRQIARFADYTLVVAATGSDTIKLQQLATRLNIPAQAIIFTGMLGYDEMCNWYTVSKLFVSIPTSDACSLSLLEAMSYGCIPVLANLPANLEWVIDGINGIINQHVDYLLEDFIRALDLTTNKVSELQSFNRQLVAAKAMTDNSLNKFMQLYFM